MPQKGYDKWVESTYSEKQNDYCGGRQTTPNELYFINKYAKENILDIGCGTGHRTFPLWIERKINFYGVEKFQNLINDSKFKNRMILSDISGKSFIESVQELNFDKIDIAFLLGGVINGLLENELQKNMWSNFSSLLNKCNCEFILIDTLTHFPWFNIENTGKELQLYNILPPQYFYSKKEIDSLNEEFGLIICEERTENIPQLKRSHYLLKKK